MLSQETELIGSLEKLREASPGPQTNMGYLWEFLDMFICIFCILDEQFNYKKTQNSQPGVV